MFYLRNILFAAFLCFFSVGYSQTKFPQKEINEFTKHALERNHSTFNIQHSKLNNTSPSGIHQLLSKFNNFQIFKFPNYHIKSSKSDTMYVLADTLISGNWLHKGTIVIGSGATLTFKKTNATILGDIVVWGDNAKLIIDSSYMYFPQQYFYQRSLIAVMKSYINISNSTLDYSGLSHNPRGY